MSESNMVLHPDIMLMQVYTEVINQLLMDNMSMHTANKLITILRDHVNDTTRYEMDIVYKWMVEQ